MNTTTTAAANLAGVIDPKLLGPLHHGWNSRHHGTIVRLWRAVEKGDIEAREAARMLTEKGPGGTIAELARRGINLDRKRYDREEATDTTA